MTNFDKFRKLWRNLNSGNASVIAVLDSKEPEYVLGNYHKAFRPFLNSGLLKIKTIEELHDDEEFVEFNENEPEVPVKKRRTRK